MKLRSQRGIAILFAIAAMGFLITIAHEMSYSVTVEYVVNSQSVHRVKAYWAARAGLDLSLLRVKLYQKAHQQFGKTPYASYLNYLWSFPFLWPLVPPPDMNTVDKEILLSLNKSSLMSAQYETRISDEGSKIDINDLGSKYKSLREQAHKRIKEIIDIRIQNDADWAREHRDFDFDKVLLNIADWVDEDTTKGSTTGEFGGVNDETTAYSTLDLPPNRSFRSVAEVRLVAGMEPFLYELLAPHLTVYGSKSINPNVASKEILKSIDESMTDFVVDKILEHREQSPFSDEKSFWAYVVSQDPKTAQAQGLGIPLSFAGVDSFRIISRGIVDGKIAHEIEVVTFDPKKIAPTLLEADKKQNPDPNQNQNQSQNQNPNPNPATPAPNSTPQSPAPAQRGPPIIVDWNEPL